MFLSFLVNRLGSQLTSHQMHVMDIPSADVAFTNISAIQITATDTEGTPVTLIFPKEASESPNPVGLLELFAAAVDDVTDGQSITDGKIWFKNGAIAVWKENELVTRHLCNHGLWEYYLPIPALPDVVSGESGLGWFEAWLKQNGHSLEDCK